MKQAFLFFFSPMGEIPRLPFFLAQCSLPTLFLASFFLLDYLSKRIAFEDGGAPLAFLFLVLWVTLIWSSIALFIKRARGADRSPWLVLTILIPAFYVIAILILTVQNRRKSESSAGGMIPPVFE